MCETASSSVLSDSSARVVLRKRNKMSKVSSTEVRRCLLYKRNVKFLRTPPSLCHTRPWRRWTLTMLCSTFLVCMSTLTLNLCLSSWVFPLIQEWKNFMKQTSRLGKNLGLCGSSFCLERLPENKACKISRFYLIWIWTLTCLNMINNISLHYQPP